MSYNPALMAEYTSATACSPDEHCLLTVLTGTVSVGEKGMSELQVPEGSNAHKKT